MISGSVIRVFVMWVWTPLRPIHVGPLTETPTHFYHIFKRYVAMQMLLLYVCVWGCIIRTILQFTSLVCFKVMTMTIAMAVMMHEDGNVKDKHAQRAFLVENLQRLHHQPQSHNSQNLRHQKLCYSYSPEKGNRFVRSLTTCDSLPTTYAILPTTKTSLQTTLASLR